MAGIADMSGERHGSRLRVAGWGTVAFLLMLPLAAMQFTDEVDWSIGDFIFAALMLGSVGLALELTVRTSRNLAFRAGVAIMLAVPFLSLWFTGAVGIIGSEDNPANLVFLVTPLFALGAAAVARFRPAGLARAMAATAIAQLVAGGIGVAAAMNAPTPVFAPEALVIIAMFTVMWLVASWLFASAAKQHAAGDAAR
jgi:hypothetical protein